MGGADAVPQKAVVVARNPQLAKQILQKVEYSVAYGQARKHETLSTNRKWCMSPSTVYPESRIDNIKEFKTLQDVCQQKRAEHVLLYRTQKSTTEKNKEDQNVRKQETTEQDKM